MTIVGSKRMIVYDDVAPLEKIRVFDARVERPPHYDTFAEFQYAYHYGDMYAPYIKQEEPLKTECQHFLDCIKTGHNSVEQMASKGLELVRILEASIGILEKGWCPVELSDARKEDTAWTQPKVSTRAHGSFRSWRHRLAAKRRTLQNGRKLRIKLR